MAQGHFLKEEGLYKDEPAGMSEETFLQVPL
jgi:hypothetical protein